MRAALLALAAVPLLTAVPSAHAAPRYTVVARVTEYLEGSVTYSGLPVGPGIAGCSWDIPLFARVVLPDGATYTCADRGIDDGIERIDIWNGDGSQGCIPCRYGDWATVEVLP